LEKQHSEHTAEELRLRNVCKGSDSKRRELTMFRRKAGNKTVAEAAGSLSAYAADRELRERLLAAAAAGMAARERAARQIGRAATMVRVARDPVVQRQLTEMVTQLKKAQERAQQKRSHKLRNGLLAVAGLGAAAATLVPSARRWIMGLIGVESNVKAPAHAAGVAGVKTIEEEIEVDVPVSTAYNQWTQFEEFPKFMEGVEEVNQLDDTLLHWAAIVAGKRAEWDAKIVDQQPDQRIAWESVDGKYTSGTVSFESVGPSRARIRVNMRYQPEGLLEASGSAAGLDRGRVRGDLERFRELIESRGSESGAWRGEIDDGISTG
jgi:uncharacterized membrane protein